MRKSTAKVILCVVAFSTSAMPTLAHRYDATKPAKSTWTTTYFDQQGKNGR